MTELLIAVGEWLAVFALLFGACLTILCGSDAAARGGRTRKDRPLRELRGIGAGY